MRTLFFGTPGRFAAPVLRALLDAGVEVAAVLVPAPPGAGPVVALPPAAPPASSIALLAPSPAPTILQIAGQAGVPILALRRLGAPEVAEALAGLRPDLACVACWPWRIPPALLALPRHGFFNVHPSLLPDLRGPEPLFWAFRSGSERSGVTIHALDAGLDSGPIAAQAGLALPAGIGGEEAEIRAAELGGGLLAEALGQLAAGALALRPQGALGSYQTLPGAADFAIDLGWPARRAFGFMRGTAHWGQPYSVVVAGARWLLAEALEYDAEGVLGRPSARSGDELRLQLAAGVLVARLAPEAKGQAEPGFL